MDTLECMRIFIEVGRRQSFVGAADALNISAVSATRQVAYLERRLGARLLQRTTRSVHLSTAGESYFDHCVAVLEAFDRSTAALSLQSKVISGTLRLAMPQAFATMRFAAMVSRFCERYPDVVLDLAIDDGLADLVKDGFDAAIRITDRPAPHLIARRVDTHALWLCASPAYLAQQGLPETPDALTAHACLGYTHFLQGRLWALCNEMTGAEEKVRVTYRLVADSGEMLCSHARLGMGIALLPSFQIREALRAGSLVRVLPQWASPNLGVWLLYSDRSYLPMKLRVFIDHMASEFSRQENELGP